MKIGVAYMPYEYNGIIIENFEDLNEYIEHSGKEIELGVRSVMKSPEPKERWDHICRDASTFNAMFHLSRFECEFKGGNPLLNLDNVINRKYRAMIETLLSGTKLIINNVGGWCPISDNNYVIKSDGLIQTPLNYFIFKKDLRYFSNKNATRYFNIENDPNLEQYTRTHLGKLDPSYSHARNALHWTKENFLNVLKEFKIHGGSGLWQYTTGSNVEQMYMYMEAALEVGLTEFIFNFNSGETEDINNFIDHFKTDERITQLIVNFV